MMKGLTVVLALVVLPGPAGISGSNTLGTGAPIRDVPLADTPVARPHDSIVTAQNTLPAPTQGQPADSQQPVTPRRLPIIDRPTRAHETASATRLGNGYFMFETEVNGIAVPMVFDTGASVVTLRPEDAARAGINPSTLQFTARTKTANGIAEVAPATIASMKVGNITRTNVAAFVARPGALSVNLLGQSFLAKMAGFAQEGNQLVLRGD